ncbi:MAG: adenylate/guanylate cyclase domain-containing protein [Chelatococcus sp.]|uniref:adenylate/guanylate cyclase domain-containing protein n=1 Tax=unclassified Chelatococcus TaxID=2638111 RepID=UPI001BCFF502|nr:MULTISPECIES: adenylate/guanylate cyclase domain-containing protein [unclassified Chelatococcus]CAH1662254.1 Class 3 adenylate cyclase [Hyphomicrobiales bacterium]MBS7741364.1 adenylate/guanylate cyclase domain-containing protein [Chelatococcus sp. HY11]MBX3536879.1 adenylate/guanylate cyclase domain-containing protein [Chelatococcus sp.]MBX3546154.1 adenylate/guanylate cyclase domain-containing protein [Chelatococcus sp.]MCO5077197.1 adenylate/guanylate cyclase domain-containing protein [C
MATVSVTELAQLTGCGVGDIAGLVELGIISPSNGSFAKADISRVRLSLALRDAGLDANVLATAIADDLLSLDFAGQLMFDPVSLSVRGSEELLASLDLDVASATRLRSAVGLPALQPDQALREDDIELMSLIAAARGFGLNDDALARVLRIFGQSVRRSVETMRDLFRGEVEDRMLASGVSRRDMLERGADMRLQLQRLGFRALFLLQRRMLEEAVFDNVVMRVQEILREARLGEALDRKPPTVAFIDLVGFTALTQAMGDERAADYASRLEALAQDTVSKHGGRLVKALGDGVMLLFPDAMPALEASFAISSRCADEGLPGVRAGLATGSVVPRDGDIFGATVNLAARIVAQVDPTQIDIAHRDVAQADHATPGQVLVCADTREAIMAAWPEAFVFQPCPPVALKGVEKPVVLHAAWPRVLPATLAAS